MPYRYLQNVAPADAAFRAWGSSLEKLFESAAEATLNVMIGDLSRIAQTVERPLTLASDALDLLLFDFLQEIVYYKDAESLLLRPTDLRIIRSETIQRLTGRLVGEPLDRDKHELLMDVKAVTLHLLDVRETAAGWEATVVLDI